MQSEWRSSDISEISKALAALQSELRPVTKTKTAEIMSRRTGKAHRYTYADLDAIWEVARDPLSKHGLAVWQTPFNADGGVGMTTVLMHGASGQWLRGDYILPGGPYASPQDAGSAITYARRYGLAPFLGITAVDEDDDGVRAEEGTPARQAHQDGVRAEEGTPARQAHQEPRAHTQPQRQPQAPKPPATTQKQGSGIPFDGGPEWLDSKVGGKGKFSFYTWRQMAEGDPEGIRHSWLEWVQANLTFEPWLEKVSWILEKLRARPSVPDQVKQPELDDDDNTPF